MRVRTWYAATAALLTLLVAGCSSSDDDPQRVADPDGTGSSKPDGGTAAKPAVADAKQVLLDWQPAGDGVEPAVTRSGEWALSVATDGATATLDGPTPRTIKAGPGRRVSDVQLTDAWALVVAQDEQEVRPATATLVELATGKESVVDGESDPPTTTGGDWSLGAAAVLRPTMDEKGGYCLVSTDPATSESALPYCAEPGTGFRDVRASPYGVTITAFDDAQPISCRTPTRVDADQPRPLPDIPECKGAESVLTEQGAVWAVVEKEQRYEAAHYFASYDGAFFDLGAGTTGSLIWCGDSAWFVRDTQKDKDKARLMRWAPGGTLEVAYESPGVGAGFLEAPRCGGDSITLTALGEGGDEQVTARLS
ncbi:hypothetical protein [Nocardioides speluncae]|uniref:hypothetical protein n=1 Tax=Nocardioides speluncae TaxID=2670337 RepID=UPI0012B17800|nr:hypothetical protein [Nocardioides speluncae]